MIFYTLRTKKKPGSAVIVQFTKVRIYVLYLHIKIKNWIVVEPFFYELMSFCIAEQSFFFLKQRFVYFIAITMNVSWWWCRYWNERVFAKTQLQRHYTTISGTQLTPFERVILLGQCRLLWWNCSLDRSKFTCGLCIGDKSFKCLP